MTLADVCMCACTKYMCLYASASTDKGMCWLGKAGVSKKRELDEAAASDGAIIHRVVMQLSPVKVSRRIPNKRCFNSRLNDVKDSVYFISFQPGLRSEMEESKTQRGAISVTNCIVICAIVHVHVYI